MIRLMPRTRRTKAEVFHHIMTDKPPLSMGPTHGCWDWRGKIHTEGYGVLNYREGPRRLHRLAHRVSYELFVGPIPAGMDVLHSCDRKVCVQPAHLRPGTQLENTREAVERGLHPRGERHTSARLTNADVILIRASNESNVELAARYGISAASISSVRTGKSWRHIEGRLAKRDITGERNSQAKLSAQKVREIRDSNLKHQQIADAYGISRTLVSMIKSGKRWNHI